jgi:hypothetical protein|tara:strand:+ start:1519 stop:2106 length:588 start_codon:yes stop_codon:yes gene_type:complete
MQIIIHRVNSIDLLDKAPQGFGVEVDIRSNNDNLILHHDPFQEGELFDEWLKFFNHQTLILNVKEEGLEERVLEKMNENKIDNFFFLDQSFPFLRKTAMAGESRCAVRVSEYESIETVKSLSGKVDWVWVDCFSKFPISLEEFKQLKQYGFKLCIVSPELQGRTDQKHVLEFKYQLEKLGIKGDAVCTKYLDLWT